MSDQGLSIFDNQRGSAQPPPPSGAAPFPVVRRGGYDRDAVDARMQDVGQLERAVKQARSQVSDLRRQVSQRP